MFFLINVQMRRQWRGLFSRSDRILDIGCGDAPRYHRYFSGKVVCADIIPTRASHLVSKAESLPLRSRSFDGIVCVNSLYCYGNPGMALGEFKRVLREKGILVLVTPFMYPIHDAPYDKYRFTRYGLEELLRKDFMVQKMVPVGGVFSIPLVLVHSIRKGVPLLAPRSARVIVGLLSTVVFFIPGIVAEIFSILDVLDRSGRWPVYYFTIARKK